MHKSAVCKVEASSAALGTEVGKPSSALATLRGRLGFGQDRAWAGQLGVRRAPWAVLGRDMSIERSFEPTRSGHHRSRGPRRPLAILTGMYERARRTTPGLAPGIRLEERPDLAGLAPMDVAERFRDLPGLVLLESARPGRNARWTYLTADPVAVLEAPSEGSDAFANARRLLARLANLPIAGAGVPPFLGGL